MGYVLRSPPGRRSVCVRKRSSSGRTLCVTRPSPRRCARSSNAIRRWVESLSLDEAYLDVTENKTGLPTATRVAKVIRKQIQDELNLTASAGVATNKFLAKIASDWKKPNGLFVIQPHEIQAFLFPLSVGIPMLQPLLNI